MFTNLDIDRGPHIVGFMWLGDFTHWKTSRIFQDHQSQLGLCWLNSSEITGQPHSPYRKWLVGEETSEEWPWKRSGYYRFCRCSCRTKSAQTWTAVYRSHIGWLNCAWKGFNPHLWWYPGPSGEIRAFTGQHSHGATKSWFPRSLPEHEFFLSRHIHVDDGFDGFKTPKVGNAQHVWFQISTKISTGFTKWITVSSESTTASHQKSKSRCWVWGGSSGFGTQRQPIQRYVAWRKGIDH